MWLWGVLIIGLVWSVAIAVDYYIFGIDYFDPELAGESNPPDRFWSATDAAFWLTLWPTTALNIKRFHDIGLSGVWYIVLYGLSLLLLELFSIKALTDYNSTFLRVVDAAPIYSAGDLQNLITGLPNYFLIVFDIVTGLIGLALLFMTLIMGGNFGANKYGPDPLGEREISEQAVTKDPPPPWMK
ncbi:MAG: hypothetical protein DHS20C05_21150 [Hyphococcus sp.]|nr:MAG: hypothetical protein DHS20C05_21150 [Marinicaulis sp.]